MPAGEWADIAGMTIEADTPPACPRCETRMTLAHVVPAVAGHPELQSFACHPCREAVTREGSRR